MLDVVPDLRAECRNSARQAQIPCFDAPLLEMVKLWPFSRSHNNFISVTYHPRLHRLSHRLAKDRRPPACPGRSWHPIRLLSLHELTVFISPVSECIGISPVAIVAPAQEIGVYQALQQRTSW